MSKKCFLEELNWTVMTQCKHGYWHEHDCVIKQFAWQSYSLGLSSSEHYLGQVSRTVALGYDQSFVGGFGSQLWVAQYDKVIGRFAKYVQLGGMMVQNR